MEQNDLLKIIPQNAKLEIKGKEYILRKMTLADEAWLQDTFGGDALEKIFSEIKLSELCRILYRVLDDKKDFLAKDVEEVNDDGELVKRRLKGHEVLMQSLEGKQVQIDIVEAILQTIGISRPMLEELQGSEEPKKKQTQKK